MVSLDTSGPPTTAEGRLQAQSLDGAADPVVGAEGALVAAGAAEPLGLGLEQAVERLLGRLANDPAMAPATIVTHYAGRWNIESTFQEARAHLGFGTTRGRCRPTVMRAAPCLLGLYSVVALLYQALPAASRVGRVDWQGKSSVTFSDALCSVRMWLWSEGVFRRAEGGAGLEEILEPVRDLLWRALAPAS